MAHAIHLAVVTFDLIMRHNTSLKHKRRIVNSVKDRLRQRLGVSVAEIAAHDLMGRAVIGVACIGSDRAYVERILGQAQRLAESNAEAEVWNWAIDWY